LSFLHALYYFILIKVKMKLSFITPLIILFIFVYLVFIFPFEILASWLGAPGSPLEIISSTFLIYFICLYYFRSKSKNKILKFFIYEGVGLGSVSLFLITAILFIEFFFYIPNQIKLSTFFSLQISLLVYGFWNARILKVKNIEINSSLISNCLTFVFISDVHIGSNHPKSLIKIVAKINELQPEFLLIGGDLIDSSSFDIDHLSCFKEIKCPIFFVTGNHEYYIQNYQKHLDDLKKVGIQILNNQSIKIGDINLIGINDNISIIEKKNQYKKLQNRNLFNLLAIHQPSLWKEIKHDVNLMLSGHTHNGQIFPFNFIVKLKFPEIYGLYKSKENLLYVSSGVATWGPKIRIGSNNELIKFELSNKLNS